MSTVEFDLLLMFKLLVIRGIRNFTKVITLFIPKIKGVILFHASNLDNYNENAKYLFEYMSANSNYNCYWVTSNKELKISLENKGLRSLMHPSLNSIYLYLRCSISISGETLPPDGLGFMNPKAYKISLSHGYGPRSTNSADGVMFKSNLDVVKAINKFNLMGFSSDYTQMLIGRGLFLLPDCKTFKTGMPRCDQLLDVERVLFLKSNRPVAKHFFKKILFESKLYLYSPTWRVKGQQNFPLIYNYENQLLQLNTALVANNSYMLISAHQLSPFDIDLSSFSNIKIFRDSSDYDVNQLLAEVDILISDYSSIITEFSLLNREMVFYLPDYDYYFNYGLNEDFITNLPGLEIKDMNNLIKIIEEGFVLDESLKEKLCNYQKKYYDINIKKSSEIYLGLINKIYNNE